MAVKADIRDQFASGDGAPEAGAEGLRRSNALLGALVRVQSRFIADVDPPTLFRELLGMLLPLTDSEYGFMAEVVSSSSDGPYLMAYMLGQGPSDQHPGPAGALLSDGVKLPAAEGVLAELLTGSSPVIASGADPRLRTIPDRHPPVHSFLGLPLCHRGETVGVIGLANRPGGYGADLVEYLHPLTTACAGIMAACLSDRRSREAERALAEFACQSRTTFDAITDGIALLDAQDRVVRCNKAWAAAFGVAEAEAIGRSCHDLARVAHFTDDVCPISRMRRSGRRDSQVVWRGERWFRVTADPVFDQEGHLSGAVHIISDITDRRAAEATLGQQAAVIQAMPQLVVMADVEGRLRFINRAGRRMLGLAEDEEISGLGIGDLFPEHAREAILNEAIPEASREGVWSAEGALLSADGVEVPVSQTLVSAAVPGGDGQFLALIATDISERLSLEQELHHAQKMEAVGRLAGGIAHDFNNLLVPIMTYSQLLIDSLEEGTPYYRYAEQVAKTAERAASLPRQLLAFSRRQVLRPQPIDLNALIREMERMVRRLIGEDISLQTDLSPSIGAIKADPGQIEQVLVNLLVNARDAMPDGGKVVIETADAELDEGYARFLPGVKAGLYVMLAVSDTGCGMDADTQSRIFEPFFTTKDAGKGTGLGLSTVYGIVAQSGGYIRVYSEPGRGSTFRIYLPRAGDCAEAHRAPRPTPAPGGTETVLLVEDEDAVRRGLSEILQLNGYMVLDAAGGDAGLALVEQHDGPVHVLVTDVVMPGMSGSQLARRLAEKHPGIKVIYISGHTDDMVMPHGVLGAGIAFLNKPFAAHVLLRKIRSVLGGDVKTTPDSTDNTEVQQ